MLSAGPWAVLPLCSPSACRPSPGQLCVHPWVVLAACFFPGVWLLPVTSLEDKLAVHFQGPRLYLSVSRMGLLQQVQQS